MQLNLIDAVLLHDSVQEPGEEFFVHLNMTIARFCEFTSYNTGAGEM